jgi:hypothetical protein
VGVEDAKERAVLPHEKNPEPPPVTMIVTKANFQQAVRRDVQKYHLILLSWHVFGLDQNPDLHSKALARLRMNLTNI